jgi:ketopantoate reductase
MHHAGCVACIRFHHLTSLTNCTHTCASTCCCVQALLSSLARGGLGAQYVDDISARLWERMAAAAAINPLTALMQVRNGKLLDSPACLDIMQQVVAEVRAAHCTAHCCASSLYVTVHPG